MKKIIFSVSTLAFVGMLVAGGTYATWSATTTVEGNTVSTAHLKLSLQQTGVLDKPLKGVNMFPGEYTDPGRIGLFNDSSIAMETYMYTDNLSDGGSAGGICDHTLLSLYTGHANGHPSVDSNGKIIDGQNNEAQRHIATKSVTEWMGAGNRVNLTGVPPFDELDPNDTQIIWQQAQLDPNAPESMQGKTCTWDEIFVGEAAGKQYHYDAHTYDDNTIEE